MMISIRAWSKGNSDQINDEEFPSRFARWRDACLSHDPVASLLVEPHQLALLQELNAVDVASDGKAIFRWLSGTNVAVLLDETDEVRANPLFKQPEAKSEEERIKEEEAAIDPKIIRLVERAIAEVKK